MLPEVSMYKDFSTKLECFFKLIMLGTLAIIQWNNVIKKI